MTVKIRKGMFETNSSSCHSFTLHMKRPSPWDGVEYITDEEYKPNPLIETNEEGKIEIHTQDFPNDFSVVSDVYTKLSYLLTDAWNNPGYKQILREVIVDAANQTAKPPITEDDVIFIGCHDWGIDHDSVGNSIVLYESKERLMQFIFNSASTIHLDYNG